MRLPNGYGSVVKLKGRRRRPYWIRKTVGWTDKGYPKYKTVGYAKTRLEGLELLAKFNSGKISENETEKYTLKDLYSKWLDERAQFMGQANVYGLKSSYRFIKDYEQYDYQNIRAYEMQNSINNCGRGYSTQAQIKSLWKHLDKFALELDIIAKSQSQFLTSAKISPIERKPFTENELLQLWKSYYEGKENIDIVLIFIYTGFRISELTEMKLENIDMVERTMKGGVKTAAGKNRIVPIHSAIFRFIKMRNIKNNEYLFEKNGYKMNNDDLRKVFRNVMKEENMDHTPHECRHTFETMLDDAGANRKCIDLMMGHASKDVGNRVYNHKTLKQLKENIELLKSYLDLANKKRTC